MTNRKVLIVEDDLAFISLIELSLRDLDFEFDVAKNGSSALQQIEKNAYVLVISDFRLPEFHGVEILKAAKKFQPNCHAVLISATTEEMIDSNLDDLDLLGFIQKPFSPIQFREMITQAFNSN